MKITYALGSFLISILLVSTAIAESEQVIDPAFLPQHCVFSASFQQKQTMAGLPKPLQSAGKIFFNCEAGLIWQQESPTVETLIYTSENKVFHISEGAKLEQKKGKLEKNLAKLLTGLMGGDTRYLNRYFIPASSSATQLELLPKGKRVAKFISRISINKKQQAKEIFWENNIGNGTFLKIFAEENYSSFSADECDKSINNIDNICQLLSNDS